MLQRIQTLFLLGAAACFTACYFVPFWNYSAPEFIYGVSVFSIKLIKGSPQFIEIGTLPVLVLVSVSEILSVVSVFYYKSRITQIKINNYNLLLTVIFIGTIFLWIPYSLDKSLPTATAEWQPGLAFPLLSLIFIILANIFIKKDEKMVKSADRLR